MKGESRTADEVRERVEHDFKAPDMYRVIMHNDDFTTMDFVVAVVMKVFSKSASQATSITLNVHTKGHETVGVYTHDVASTKIDIVHAMARESEFPLLCTLEKA